MALAIAFFWTLRRQASRARPAALAAPTLVMVIDATGMHDDADVCRACGACCSYSAEWPRFSLESCAELDRIPRAFVDDERGRMRCEGNRCTALVGEVGVATSCAVYAVRPEVCRACLPGDDACQMARRRFNLEHDPEQARPGRDPGRMPVSRLREALGTIRRLA